MTSLVKFLRRLALGIGLLLLLLVVVLGIASNTEGFRQKVRQQVIAAVNAAIRGELALERIEGSIWGNVTLHQVRLRYDNADIVEIPQLKLSYALWPLLHGQLQITGADALDPTVRLVRDRQGDWNIAKAFASDTPPPQLTILLRSLRLSGGNLEIRLDDDTPQRYQLKNLALSSRLTIAPKRVEFEAGELSGRLASEPFPDVALKGGLAYRVTESPPTVVVRDLQIDGAASRLKLSGQWVGSGLGSDKSQIDARLTLVSLAPADATKLLTEWPLQKAITGQIDAKGPFDALAVRADLAAAGAKLKSDLWLNVLAPAATYRGTINVAGFDARALLGLKRVAGVFDGTAKVQGTGFNLEKIGGNGAFAVRSLQVENWALGNLSSNVELRAGAALLAGTLAGTLGSAQWRGKVSLEKTPSYDFDLAVSQLDIRKVAAGPDAPRGVVSFKGKVRGEGITLAQLKAEADLTILPSTLGSLQVSGGDLSAAFGDGRIRIARGRLRSTDSLITVKGDIGTALDQRGKLDFEVQSGNITPWLSLVGQKGAGALAVTGTAQGSLADLTARGQVKASRVQWQNFGAGSGTVDFDLTRSRGQELPAGNIVARLADLTVGAGLQRLDASIKLLPGREMQVEVRAQDGAQRSHSVRANIDYRSPEISARIGDLSLHLPDGRWTLVQPAVIAKHGETFAIENFRLRNQERQAMLAGNISMSGAQALNVAIDRFPLESLAALLPKQLQMTGLLALQAKIGGTAAAPQIDGRVRLVDSTIGGEKYDGLVAEISYGQRHAGGSLTVHQDRSHSLNATAKLPLLLSWHDGWRSEATGDLDLRIKSSGLSLAFLNAYTAKTVRQIAGEMSIDVTARGPFLDPRWSGSARLNSGKLQLTALNVDVADIGADVRFDQQRLTIDNFTARSEDGRLTGSGALALKQYRIDNLKFALAARRWPAIQTRRYQARIGGNVELTGSLNAPKLAGRIDVAEANVRPDLAFLARSSTPALRDEAIVIVSRDGTVRSEPAKNQADNGLNSSELFKRLALDLDLRMPRDVWVRHPDAVVELRGQVRATKTAGQELQLIGSNEIVRGWAAFQGRRFDFVRGEIRFVGGAKVDPVLDMVAQHRLPQYTVNAVVGGTAENPSLLLRSEPALDQSDILSLLVFGKPIKDLNRGEQVSLKQSALDITSGFAAAKIGSAVAEAIGLDALGFDLGDFDFSGGRIGYGRYIGRRTYVTFSQELSGERGQKATVEYQISRDWKIESSTTSKGTSDIGVIWHKRY